MRDQIFDRGYQDGREALNGGIDRLLARLGKFFRRTGEAQVRAEWSAPWRTRSRSSRNGIA